MNIEPFLCLATHKIEHANLADILTEKQFHVCVQWGHS